MLPVTVVVVVMIPVMMVVVIPPVVMVMMMMMMMPRQLRALVLPGLRFRALGIRGPSSLQ
jgi:hypothetical protein